MTACVQTMIDDSGAPDVMMPDLSDAEKYFLSNHEMLSEEWALGEKGSRAWGDVLDLCLDDLQVQATAMRGGVKYGVPRIQSIFLKRFSDLLTTSPVALSSIRVITW